MNDLSRWLKCDFIVEISRVNFLEKQFLDCIVESQLECGECETTVLPTYYLMLSFWDISIERELSIVTLLTGMCEIKTIF